MTDPQAPEATYRKPLPSPNDTSRPFWDGLQQGRLLIQLSKTTGNHVFYPREASPFGAGDELEWVEASGRGTVYAFTIARRPPAAPWADDVPYVYAIVELAEGPRLTTNIVECDPESVAIGMAVEASFDHVTPEVTLLKFKPVS
ncbi:MAG: Zn-ribbon domain-containing OB-fold protein [Dehalococcoidia bacterium]